MRDIGVEITLVNNSSQYNNLSVDELAIVHIDKFGPVVIVECIEEGTLLLPGPRISNPIGLDFAISQVESTLSTPLQVGGKLQLQPGNGKIEGAPLTFEHADGEQNVQVVFAVEVTVPGPRHGPINAQRVHHNDGTARDERATPSACDDNIIRIPTECGMRGRPPGPSPSQQGQRPLSPRPQSHRPWTRRRSATPRLQTARAGVARNARPPAWRSTRPGRESRPGGPAPRRQARDGAGIDRSPCRRSSDQSITRDSTSRASRSSDIEMNATS